MHDHDEIYDDEWSHNPRSDIHMLLRELEAVNPQERYFPPAAIEHFAVLVRYACAEDPDYTYRILQKYLQENPKSPLVYPWLTGQPIGTQNFAFPVQHAWFQLQRLLPVEQAAKNMSRRLTLWMDRGEQYSEDASPIPGIAQFMNDLSNHDLQTFKEIFKDQQVMHLHDVAWLLGGLRSLLNNDDMASGNTWLDDYLLAIFRYHLVNDSGEDIQADTVAFVSNPKIAQKHTLWPKLANAFHGYFQRLDPQVQDAWFDVLAQDCYINDETVQYMKSKVLHDWDDFRDAMYRRIELDIRFPQCITEEENAQLYNARPELKHVYLTQMLKVIANSNHKMVRNSNTINNDTAQEEDRYAKWKQRLNLLMEQTQYLTSQEGLDLWIRTTNNTFWHEKLLHRLGDIFGIEVYNPVERKWSLDGQARLLCALDTRLNPEQVKGVYRQWQKQHQVHKDMELPPPEFTLEMLQQALHGQHYAIDVDVDIP